MSVTHFPERVGGRLCLDFVNTVDPRSPSPGHDYLADYRSILDWCKASDIPLPRPISWLRTTAKAKGPQAADAHR